MRGSDFDERLACIVAESATFCGNAPFSSRTLMR